MTAPDNNPIPTRPNSAGPGDIPPQPLAGPSAMPPPSSYPAPQWQPPSVSAPAKKSPWAKVGSVGASLLVIVALIAVRIGFNADGDSLFGDDPPRPTTPFEDTPADAFATGEAGIVVPAATALTDFAAEEVAAALSTVKKAMVAGRISETMLYDHDRAPLLSLFSDLDGENIDAMFEDKQGGVIATMVAPGYQLTSDPVRVKGEMTFRARTLDDDIRAIEVKTNFVWVYAFTGLLISPGDHLVTVRDQHTWVFPHPDDVDAASRGMWLWGDESQMLASNIDCALFDKDLIALGKPIAGGADTDPDQAFDPNDSFEVSGDSAC